MTNKYLYPLLGIGFTVCAFAVIATNYDKICRSFSNKEAIPKALVNVTETEYSMDTEKPEKKQKTKENEAMHTIHDTIQEYQHMNAYSIVDVSQFAKTDLKKMFTVSKISNSVFKRMYKKSYKENCTVPKDSLRYIRILHTDLDGNTRIGELVVNKSIADDVKTIFYKLYLHGYPIEKMVLVDEYEADDNASMADNNSSSFNYRVVEGTNHLSKHSLGLAIDINPRYNPYIHTLNGQTVCSPENGSDYVDRTKDFPYKIDTEDYAYKLFLKYGFSWGGSWNNSKDYQHFQVDAE